MLVQYLDKDLILLDGIAQPARTDQKSPQTQTFQILTHQPNQHNYHRLK